VDGAAGELFVMGVVLAGDGGLAGEVPVTTGGGDKGVDGSRPAIGDEEDTPGRAVRVGISDGDGIGDVLADFVGTSGCSAAAVVGNTVVYCVSVMTTRLDSTVAVKLPCGTGVAVGVTGMPVGKAVAVGASVEFCC
jgi:hypothetical protein